MKLHRIKGVILRYLFDLRHSWDRLSEVFYWPVIDLVMWGLTISYFKQFSPNPTLFVVAIISGIIFWIFAWRAEYELSISLLSEMWDKNLINLFVSPLKFSEWVSALLILSLVKGLLSTIVAMIVAFFLFQTHIFTFGFLMIPFMMLLIMSGWALGFTIAGIILRYGTKVQTLAWTTAWAFAPFSAIYYPVEILPGWAQFIARCLPTSYVFEGTREVLFHGTLDPMKLLISFLLNLFYLTLALIFLWKSFKKVLERGLVNVY